MHLMVPQFLLLILSTAVWAGPIHMRSNVIRRRDEPQKRYVINDLLTVTKGFPRKRQAPTQAVTGIDALATPTRKGTEDGSVPAVGVGGDNTSLLSFLTFSQTQSVTTVAAAAPAAAETSTTDGSAASDTPSVAAGDTTGDSTAATGTGTGTAIQPDAAEPQVQPQTTSTTTVQVQTTVVATFIVTAETTAPATDSPAQGAAPSATGPGQQVEQQPSATVAVVFVTAEPTFTGPTAGFTTLSPDASANPGSTMAESSTTAQAVALTAAVDGGATGVSTPNESRPTTVTTASPFPDTDTVSTAATATVTATSTTTVDGVAVVPVTPSPVQGQITVTETVTMTVTAR
ncbi:hypothetical protein A1O1_00732 [Capronia coronata CBS 617.96]|uniref:Uncharacterized protein n=1 Tax=Capronia coronata CBS 617.96 TaxID=1182541 RepID=W9Z0Y2_9EURO|nr:uncharacterized protein A1O1_00732 [Capronia coronata CBS 617.96]EXJ95610.1 hypothetical protein A1O1_00732 [Capronia coronata CBS 617.96]